MKVKTIRLFSFLMITLLMITPVSAQQAADGEVPSQVDSITSDYELTILHTNDNHARVDQYNRNGARCTEEDDLAGLCIAGTPRLATKVSEIRGEVDNVVLLDAGDQFQGTLFFNLFKEEILNLTMNYLEYDAMTVGNHEFDDGPATLAAFITGSVFPIVSANIDASADADLAGLIPPYTIVEEGGEQIGIVGLTTPETENISSPGPDIVFNDPLTSLQAAADVLTGLGVDKIIALTHQGYDVDVEMAAQVSDVDVIIGGHSHTFTYTPTDPIKFYDPEFPQYDPLAPAGEYPTFVESLTGEPVLVVTAYQWGTFLGRLDVGFDADGVVDAWDGNPIYLGTDVEKNAMLDGMLDPYRDAVADLVETMVGETTVDLLIDEAGVRICRVGECLLGNLVADAMLWKANEMEPGANYQIAFQNGGGLRAPILTGEISMGDVLETLPFGNTIATFELKGEYVKEALENGARLYPSANGGFAQVSGLKYVIDPNQPAGSRISNVQVWNGVVWSPLNSNAYYKVVTNDFMRRGGDNYTVFRDYAVDPYDFGPLLDEALADYLQEFSPVTPEIEGRVTFEYNLFMPLVMVDNAGVDYYELTVLHTNDFHARVDQYNRNGARCTEEDDLNGLCIAGTPRLATVVNDIRDITENVLLLDAGDQFQGTLFFTLFKEQVLNETMNYLGYDAMTVGNHEFDDGPATLAAFIEGADFPVVSANINASADPYLAGLIPPYTIVEKGGEQIGIVGLTTPETENISSPGPYITFTDPLTSLQAAVYMLTAQGVDKIIALTHQGYDQDVELAAQVSGVDIIIGGHSHTFTYSPTDPIYFYEPQFPQYSELVPAGEYPTVVSSPAGEPVLVVTAYQWGTFLGRLDVGFNDVGQLYSFTGNPIYLGTDVEKDATLDGMLDPYREDLAELVATEVGETTVDLMIEVGGERICRLGECLLGNLVADAMLWKANEMEPTAGYQIAFQNGGGLRAPILAGEVTMGDVLETLPFGNAIATFQLQGVYVKEALENGARLYPDANGGFAQVAGLRYTIDSTQPAWSRVTNVEVWNGAAYEALDEDAMYKVVTNDFMRLGGDNYYMFLNNAVDPYDYGPLLDEGLADYLGEFSPVTPVFGPRITIN